MNYDSKEIITIISIFTLAAVKLLPSFNRILLLLANKFWNSLFKRDL